MSLSPRRAVLRRKPRNPREAPCFGEKNQGQLIGFEIYSGLVRDQRLSYLSDTGPTHE